jgi:RNAse (barnase) inhibitor barstar
MPRQTYTIDGSNFDDLDGFYEEISRVLIPGEFWGRNLDAFNDVLYGGFGTPKEGFTLIWKNAARSRQLLGYEFTVKFWERRLAITGNPALKIKLEKAKQHQGQTIFDILMEIIYDDDHPEVTLVLE